MVLPRGRWRSALRRELLTAQAPVAVGIVAVKAAARPSPFGELEDVVPVVVEAHEGVERRLAGGLPHDLRGAEPVVAIAIHPLERVEASMPFTLLDSPIVVDVEIVEAIVPIIVPRGGCSARDRVPVPRRKWRSGRGRSFVAPASSVVVSGFSRTISFQTLKQSTVPENQ